MGAAGCATVEEAVRPTPAPPTPPSETYEVATRQEMFVDDGRRRTLPTTIWYPRTDGAVPDGPLGVVVFSHGLGAVPEGYDRLVDRWVRSGIVVAAPAYPLTSGGRGERTVPFDLPNQPADASFVLSSVLELSERGGDVLEGRLDGARIAAAGHSLGGMTTFGLFSACCADDRFGGGISLAGADLGFRDDPPPATRSPMLFIHGDADDVVSAGVGRQAYEAFAGPKAFLTLHDGAHSAPFVRPDDPHFDVVADVTLAFLRWVLFDDEASLAELRGSARAGGVSFDDELG